MARSFLRDTDITRDGQKQSSRSRDLLFQIAFLALLLVVSALLLASCGDQGMSVTTTTEHADLTQSRYDQIEMDMSYEDVVNIVGQEPNQAEEVPDEVRETGKVLKCTWEGKPGTGEYQGESRLDVSFYEEKVCELEATNL